MSGILRIHSIGSNPRRPFGHSWLEFTTRDGISSTYGTWGNDPVHQGNGLLQDLELGFQPDATRTRNLTDEEELRLAKKIREYRARGPRAWTVLSPCSTFAAETWEYTTGERLQHHTAGISNPSRLTTAIVHANRRDRALQGSVDLLHHPVPHDVSSEDPSGRLKRSESALSTKRSKGRRRR